MKRGISLCLILCLTLVCSSCTVRKIAGDGDLLSDVTSAESASGQVSSAEEPASSAESSAGTSSAKMTSSAKASSAKTSSSAAPKTESGDWNLILVNPSHPLSKELNDHLVKLTVAQQSNGNGKYFDERAAGELTAMFDAAKAAGINLNSRSTYRTFGLQQTYFDSHINSYMKQGMTREQAKVKTLEYTAAPGTSEHHTGLAIDITTVEWEKAGKGLSDSFEETEAAKWLNEHAAEYGFILRYPKAKESITKIKYEPWHFRYVGKEHAEKIKKSGVCLEEYLGILD